MVIGERKGVRERQTNMETAPSEREARQIIERAAALTGRMQQVEARKEIKSILSSLISIPLSGDEHVQAQNGGTEAIDIMNRKGDQENGSRALNGGKMGGSKKKGKKINKIAVKPLSASNNEMLKPFVARANSILGFVKHSEGVVMEAIILYNNALCLDPSLIDARRNIIPALASIGKYAEAENHAVLLTMLRPDDEDAHFSVGVVKMHRGDMSGAAEAYKNALKAKPGFREAHINLDSVLLKLGMIEDCRHWASVATKTCDMFWTSAMQRPPHFVSGIRSRPWYDSNDFSWIKRLEGAWAAIRNEGMAAMTKAAKEQASKAMPVTWGQVGGRALHDGSLVASGEWRELLLFGTGGAGEEGRRQCPFTSALLSSIPEIVHAATVGVGEALFSVLSPTTHLRPHCGSTNARLTAHLGVRVPSGCRIRCGDVERTWEEGKCIVFDDSFEHEVWHNGDEPRLVLLMNFWHPDYPRSKWGPLEINSHYKVS